MKAEINIKSFGYYDWWQSDIYPLCDDVFYVKEQFIAIILGYANPIEL